MNLSKAKKVYFIGIGGIGVSALAKYFHYQGIFVSGSDLKESKIIKDLRDNFEITIKIGSNPDLITQNTDLVIYSAAIPENDSEYQKAKLLNIPMMTYAEALGELSKEKKTIAIAGTNGKTTTTSMLVEAMKNQNIHPTVIVGGILQKYNSNYLSGDSEYLILEACEYKRSFVNIHHDIAVITNITEDHLDYFENLADIQSAFVEFIDNKKGSGILICNKKLENLEKVIIHAEKKGIQVYDYSKYLEQDMSSVYGEHNKQNTATTLAIIEALGLDVEKAKKYLLHNFEGTKRRMEYIGITKDGALIYDDYGHNPEGIELLIDGLREKYPDKKLILLFEPHLYSRTEDFKEEFGRVLSKADVLYLFPVYRAREQQEAEKDFLLEKYISKENNFFVVHEPEKFKTIFEEKHYGEDYIVVSLGAGDIWQKGLEIKKQD